MVYSVVANEPNAFRDTTHGDIRGTFELTKGGIVGEKGIIVSAEYNNRVDTGSSNLAYRGTRPIGIIPELSLYAYSDGTHLAAHYNVRSGETVLKDFTTNKAVFTFKHTEGWSNIDFTVGYYSSEKVFFLGKYLGRDGTQKSYLVRIDGTIVPNVEASVTYEDKQNNLQQRVSLKATFIDFTEPVNGHTVIMERVNFDDYVNKANSYKTVKVKNIVSLSTGTVYKHTNLEGSECSDVSVNNTLWVNKGNDTEQKWGLVDLQGRVLLPFEYEICNQRDNYVDYYGRGGRIKIWPEWNRKENAYMAVKKNGSSTVEWLDTMGKPFTGRIYTVPEGWDLSKHIPATNRGLEYRKPPNRLAYLSAGDYYGPEGKIVFPEAEIKSYDAAKMDCVDVGLDLTLVVKDGKVGYVNASRLARAGSPPPAAARVKPVPVALPLVLQTNLGQNLMFNIGETIDMGTTPRFMDEKGFHTAAAVSDIVLVTSDGERLRHGQKITADMKLASGTKKEAWLEYKGVKVFSDFSDCYGKKFAYHTVIVSVSLPAGYIGTWRSTRGNDTVTVTADSVLYEDGPRSVEYFDAKWLPAANTNYSYRSAYPNGFSFEGGKITEGYGNFPSENLGFIALSADGKSLYVGKNTADEIGASPFSKLDAAAGLLEAVSNGIITVELHNPSSRGWDHGQGNILVSINGGTPQAFYSAEPGKSISTPYKATFNASAGDKVKVIWGAGGYAREAQVLVYYSNNPAVDITDTGKLLGSIAVGKVTSNKDNTAAEFTVSAAGAVKPAFDVIAQNGVYRIQSASNKYLHIEGSSNNNNAAIVTQSAAGGANAQFRIERSSDNTYTITAVHSNKMLDITGVWTGRGIPIVQYEIRNDSCAQWVITSISDGYYKITNARSGQNLTIPDNGTQNDLKMVQQPYTGAAGQKFKLIPVTGAGS
jgi:hypothetical protein